MKRDHKWIAKSVSLAQLTQAKATIMEESSSEEDEEIMRMKHMTRDVSVAMAHYQSIWDVQRHDMRKPRWFGGERSEHTRASVSSITPARRKHSRRRDETMVRLQLAALPTFTPWFTYIITAVQVLFTVAINNFYFDNLIIMTTFVSPLYL